MNKAKYALIAAYVMFSVSAFSQKLENTLKVNVSSLALKNFSFQYERGLTKHVSFALGVRVEPKGNIPLQSLAENVFDKGDFNLDALQMGNTAITPEIRFYLGTGRNRGFYIAPYARYAKFNLTLPVTFTTNSGQDQALFDGHVTSFSGGVLFGMQYTFGKVIVLDIWMLGGHYGSSNGNAIFTPSEPLSNDEQQGLRDKLNGISIKPFTFTSTVSSSGATIATTGPWVGLRALGINLGVRF